MRADAGSRSGTVIELRASMNPRGVVIIASSCLVGCTSDDPDLATEPSSVNANDFVLPDLTADERAAIVHNYDALDPTGIVPRGLLEDAIIYFDFNKPLIPIQDQLVVIDLSQYSGHDRFWIVDLASGTVERHKVAHGDGSDPNNDGFATTFGNVDGSHKSSLGFYLTAEIFNGSHPHSMRIDGLSPDGSPNGMADTNVRERAIIVHPASYVSDSNTSQQGRSNGCFALDPNIELDVVNRLHGGTLMYAAISPLHPPIGRTCGTIPAAGAVIDDTNACFVGGGPASTLRHVTTAGLNNTLVWTHTTSSAKEANFATWNLSFAEAGRYRVEAYTAAPYAHSKTARYVVHTSTGDHSVVIDQNAINGYQSLGEFDFAKGGSQFVHLGDNTGEALSAQVQLAFDAVRLTRIE
jgi:L,D-transpeptidase-like protein